MLISNMIFLVVSLRRVAPNTSEQRSRSGLCEGVIRREANETEGLVLFKLVQVFPEISGPLKISEEIKKLKES